MSLLSLFPKPGCPQCLSHQPLIWIKSLQTLYIFPQPETSPQLDSLGASGAKRWETPRPSSPGGPAGAVTGAFRRCPTRDICSFSLAAARAGLCRSPRGLPGAASWHTAPGSWFCSDRAVTKPASWIIHQRPCPAAASALPGPAGSCCATETPGVAGGHQGTLTAVLRAPGPSCITPRSWSGFRTPKVLLWVCQEGLWVTPPALAEFPGDVM